MAKSKKELDKDLMFQKIMPALSSNPFYAETLRETTLQDEDPNALSALRDKIFARGGSFMETEHFAAVNVMENLVLKNVDAVMKRFNVCTCDRCRCDMCAYALNLLTPNYVVAHPSRLEEIEEATPKKPVIDALIKAAITVRANPNH